MKTRVKTVEISLAEYELLRRIAYDSDYTFGFLREVTALGNPFIQTWLQRMKANVRELESYDFDNRTD